MVEVNASIAGNLTEEYQLIISPHSGREVEEEIGREILGTSSQLLPFPFLSLLLPFAIFILRARLGPQGEHPAFPLPPCTIRFLLLLEQLLHEVHELQ